MMNQKCDKRKQKTTRKIFLPPTTQSSVQTMALEVVRKKAFSSPIFVLGRDFPLNRTLSSSVGVEI